MRNSVESEAYKAHGRRRSMQTVAVIAGLMLFICVVFGGLFGAAQFIG